MKFKVGDRVAWDQKIFGTVIAINLKFLDDYGRDIEDGFAIKWDNNYVYREYSDIHFYRLTLVRRAITKEDVLCSLP